MAGYVRGAWGIRREPTSAHFHLCLMSSMPSGVSISFSERKSSSSWRLICKTPWTSKKSIGAATSHCSLGGGAQLLVGNTECHRLTQGRQNIPIGHCPPTHPRLFYLGWLVLLVRCLSLSSSKLINTKNNRYMFSHVDTSFETFSTIKSTHGNQFLLFSFFCMSSFHASTEEVLRSTISRLPF